MKLIKDDTYELSTGRQFYANCGIIGLSATSDAVSRGFDEHIDYINTSSELKAKYGLTVEEYDRMFLAQKGLCLICTRPPVTRRLAVDHSHTTKHIRGLLCPQCNKCLGWYEKRRNRIEPYLAGALNAKAS